MGYNTDFFGKVKIEPAISEELKDYINNFSNTRRMKRDIVKLHAKYEGDFSLDGDYGIEGEFFIGGDSSCYSGKDDTVLDVNEPPSTQPGLWCQWVINPEGEIEWDGNEKFYNALEWMEYLVGRILAPRGYVCNGEIEANGEEAGDIWKIVVDNNNVRKLNGRVIYE